jgi:hypothetical protein
MKRLLLTAMLSLPLPGLAMAEENFVPTGPGYSTEIDSVADINSARDKLNAGTDVIESDIYRRARENQQRDSYLRRFFSDTENSGSDFSIDY